MKAAGIIMECNPFHEGHAYLLQEARKRTGADYVTAVISGDFVQRGEPAVFDKYLRAEQILKAGADLVLELPLYAACGSAEYFARGGIALLESLGVVTDLCFGSESGDISRLQECARLLELAEGESGKRLPDFSAGREENLTDCQKADLSAYREEDISAYREKLRAGLRAGLSFPAARSAALGGILPSSPNDLLGTEYCRAVSSLGSSMRPMAVRRISVPSASFHRRQLLEKRKEQEAASLRTSSSLLRGSVPAFPLGPDDFSSFLLYALHMEAGRLEEYADVSPALADRIRGLMPRFEEFSLFADLVKTRNLTRSRVSRCLLHILLQIREDRLRSFFQRKQPFFIRPLAIRRDSSPLLSAIRRSSSAPFLPKLSRAESILTPEAMDCLQEELRAENLYTAALWQASGASRFSPAPRAAGRRIVTI